MPKVTALRSGQFPAGNHWVQGETRDLDVDGALPAWLQPVEEPAAKKATKKAKKDDAE